MYRKQLLYGLCLLAIGLCSHALDLHLKLLIKKIHKYSGATVILHYIPIAASDSVGYTEKQ
jgi:hypothetical protein